MDNGNIKDINELRKEKEEKEKKQNIHEEEKEVNVNENKEEQPEENVSEKEEVKEDKEIKEEKKEEVKEEESLEDKYNKLNESYLRILADFDNYKKRAAKDREAMIIYSTSKFAEGLFPIIDNFKRALESEEDKESGFYAGVNMIFTQLSELLKSEGIETIEAVDTVFDPNKHNAVAVDKVEDKEDNIVLEVFQDGYVYKEKVLRPAMVKVNKLK